MSATRRPGRASRTFARLRSIDGRHPYRERIPDGHVPYAARRMHGSRVVFWNHALAREMGLVPEEHPDRLTPELAEALLDAVSVRSINEYDLERKRRFARGTRLDRTYMATRYLALQHPGRTGKTSGDGRSVWNGTVTHGGQTWDVTSCGTGVTRLCPATATEAVFLRTGNDDADYGCGTATVQEGLIAALMSETFHRNGIATERVLAVLELSDGFAVNVRAGRNLLRPSHFFVHLKQHRREALAAAADCFIERQIANGAFPALRGRSARYRRLAQEMARTFGRLAATFEREYVFCWLDWDGDNILADGGIIDYGSVRQFGLFHREYRFDDGPRWSTTIPEQRRKARYIVQTFAQIRDYLITGEKPTLRSLARDPVLRLFDREFARQKDLLLLRDVGFDPGTQRSLLVLERKAVREFSLAHAWFERARSARGPRKVADGISWNAIYSTRDLLRELPVRLLQRGGSVPAGEVLDMALSSYATLADRQPTALRLRRAARLVRAYVRLVEAAGRRSGRNLALMLGDVAARSAIINRPDRVTGDGVLYAAERLARLRRRLGPDGLYEVVRRFGAHQARRPESKPVAPGERSGRAEIDRILASLIDLLASCRHGL